MKWLILVLVFLAVIDICNANILINEIMAHPIADDSLNEWVELYNNGSGYVNVSGFIIGDDGNNKSIEGGKYGGSGTIIQSHGYAIITSYATRVYNNFNVSNNAVKLYVNDSRIGYYGLDDDGEKLYLYDKDRNLIHSIKYNSTGEGNSFALFNGSFWHEANATPGYNNNGSIIYSIEETNACDWKIEILINKTIFENHNDFSFHVRASKIYGGDSTNITVKATINDLFGNIIEEYNPWINKKHESITSPDYTPNTLKDGKLYFIKASLDVQCNDSSPENNFEEKIIAINSPLPENSSFLSIENIYDLGSDDKAKFGQTIRVKATIYKGNTTKESVALYIERGGKRLTKESKTNADTKYTNYSLTLPLQIVPNCNDEFENGTYTIYLEGLDKMATSSVVIEGLTKELCRYAEVTEISSASKPKEKKFVYGFYEVPKEVFVGKRFNTKVKITNNDREIHDATVTSYVYRGSKHYSESDTKTVTLPSEGYEIVEMENIIDDAEPGDYKLKVKIRKDDQKTEHELTETIAVKNQEKIAESKSAEVSQTQENRLGNTDNEISGSAVKQPATIYESASYKSGMMLPYILIASLSILSLALIFIKK